MARVSLALAVAVGLADCAGQPLQSGTPPIPTPPGEDSPDGRDAGTDQDAQLTDALDAMAEAMTYSPKPPMVSIYTAVSYRCGRMDVHVDFELHTTMVLPPDQKVIETVAQVLKDRSYKVRTIEVTGHVHWAEGKSQAWLAAARATKVKTALVKLGVEPARVRLGNAEERADAGSPPACVTIVSVEFDDPGCAR